MIIGELIEVISFDHNVGDKLVKHGLMPYHAIRNYQVWREYRMLIPKDEEQDIERGKKTQSRECVMKRYRLTKKNFYAIIKMMESDV